MVTPLIFGVGVVAAGLAARQGLRSAARSGTQLSPLLQRIAGTHGASAVQDELAGPWIKGGFQIKMDRKEAINILGLKESHLTSKKLKEQHRKIMLANHPDRGGSPFLASKINEAKDLLDRQTR
ncbi:uncharacterized protein L969DRAFT_88922 [Mixia osmundae IAM 14324]|uniref:Mitochondrial import inner membrane translocase subunit TIM14 n=1 Tax=Mixia osmundae (strain CBS 9802 / IAM 14324 / JCM 22182 / KY 12970) TaxID=764103 RepID=G7E7S1_MIXOS|nr:uncharacterized protein L969DRAFT_88922 [Mixia osmundae IAM 14324]KEI38481.1 hypothetical protein L969DRAFT_88922 [Mixia osmundae IAM 14324]GAA98881.1 hypothetical protein E5Q_05569 [Mixia osmundae IAM 14324]